MSTSAPARARQDQIFSLPDGRALTFAEYGSSTGTPVLYFHGFPSSRLEASATDKLALRRRLRIIAIDRPGFGLSTPQHGRTILDWVTDVQNFAAGMKIDRFAVLGLSGGGPYALACAYGLPRGMLTGIGLFASGPPWEAGVEHLERYRRVMGWLAKRMPGVLRRCLDGVVRVVRWIMRTGFVVRRVEGWLEKQAQIQEQKQKEEKGVEMEGIGEKGEGKMMSRSGKRSPSERREDLYHLLLNEPFRQGAGPTVQETVLLSSPDWGFRFQDVKCEVPVRIWHGAKDANAPVSMIRYMAERLPNCIYREYEDDTHYTMFKHLEEALSELVPGKAEHAGLKTA
ncbi:Alpha/Beta hydrolase protein [Clohesyomyces aquaticus]|uniref:Alpha/Beta hydrolase protein n=1 Tax=Clohesyomyces aquaticus TaxID=1231657 RepID=A0A1Y1YTS6_9PLEO|nr:Alpha/Beta hydrolase protein [Clohesyomyces aquaticus]